MSTKKVFYTKRLQKLELKRRTLANQIDKYYLQNNISDMLKLESMYEMIVCRISRIQSILSKEDNFSSAQN